MVHGNSQRRLPEDWGGGQGGNGVEVWEVLDWKRGRRLYGIFWKLSE